MRKLPPRSWHRGVLASPIALFDWLVPTFYFSLIFNCCFMLSLFSVTRSHDPLNDTSVSSNLSPRLLLDVGRPSEFNVRAWLHTTEYLCNGFERRLERQSSFQDFGFCPCFRQKVGTSIYGWQLCVNAPTSHLTAICHQKKISLGRSKASRNIVYNSRPGLSASFYFVQL